MMTKKKLKEQFKEKIDKLSKELEEEIKENSKYLDMLSDTQNKLLESKKECLRLNQEIISLRQEIDIFKEYYHPDRELTSEEQIKVLINLRVHDLEKENSDLKAELNQTKLSLDSWIYRKNYIYIPPYPGQLYL